MPEVSPRLSLPYIQPSQAQKHVTHNEALQRLDVLTQLNVVEFGAQTPPAIPTAGDTYALGPVPVSEWNGKAGMLAFWDETAWIFITPQEGWRAWGKTEEKLYIYRGSDWAVVHDGMQNLDGVGVGTSYDATNKLAVASDATLLSHNGAGHQLKINKAVLADTASLLYQTNYTGHAEMGLNGDNAFSIKTSADGSSWNESLKIDPVSATVSMRTSGTLRARISDTAFQINVPITGRAVQGNALDTDVGVLMGVGAFGLGATDSGATRVSDGQQELASGFYSGSGGSADASTFPHSSCRYSPFLTLNRRNTTGSYSIRRMYFNKVIPIVDSSTNNGSTWAGGNTLYGTANAVGAVSQSGGSPTGAVIEQGSNANGEFTRFADGTQICVNNNVAITTSPAAFVGTITKIDGDKLWLGRWF